MLQDHFLSLIVFFYINVILFVKDMIAVSVASENNLSNEE